jgi:hypothetical protein
MLQAPALVRAQLSEALTIISRHDFPQRWGNLLPELVQKLDSSDLAVVQGVLETANSIFKRYRWVAAAAGKGGARWPGARQAAACAARARPAALGRAGCNLRCALNPAAGTRWAPTT